MFAGRDSAWCLRDGWSRELRRAGVVPYKLAQPDASVWSYRLRVLLFSKLSSPSLRTWAARRVRARMAKEY